jgi:hypothetical protein
MSSQETVHVSLMEVTPTSGKGTLGTWRCHFQRGGRTLSRHEPTHEMELSCAQTIRSRGVCAPALKPRGEWEGSRTRCQGFKPDLGNSAVRHYRGAFENVAMVEMRTQLAIERAGLVTLHLQPARRSSIPTIDIGSVTISETCGQRSQKLLDNGQAGSWDGASLLENGSLPGNSGKGATGIPSAVSATVSR